MAGLMFQGTGSDVGKSVLVAGLCRALLHRGLRVLPFKPQNMSNNAAVTVDGGEIGRAQALQAIACGVEPHTDMNPVLLKPQADHQSQLIVHGHVRGQLDGGNFRQARATLLPDVLASWKRLSAQCDILMIEGAGSAAEINLRAGDIANMGFARATHTPVILVGDIDRGGVIASIVGTRAVLPPEDGRLIKGFLINKFRGNPELFHDGYRQIETLSDWKGYGLIPWLDDVRHLPAEDAVALQTEQSSRPSKVVIACPILPHIANFDDLDPWKSEPDVELRMIPRGKPIPQHADLIILAGSKASISDMLALRNEGWDIDIHAHHRAGKPVLGICAGFQMLGKHILDPDGREGDTKAISGLGLLDIETIISGEKRLVEVSGEALGCSVSGYEMHMGKTYGPDRLSPFAKLHDGRSEGAISADGLVYGSYLHGCFAHPSLRASILKRLGGQSSGLDQRHVIDRALDNIARKLEVHADIDGFIALAQRDAQ